MAFRFKASSTGEQPPETVRQFRDVERALEDLERRIVQDVVLGFIIPNFTFAAHGTMFNTDPVVGPNIGGSYTTVDVYDTVTADKRILFEPDIGDWTYINAGVYLVNVQLILTHNESNGGRTFYVRLNDGQARDGVPVAVGRNQPGTNLSLSFLQDVPIGETDRSWRLQVGAGDTLSNVTWEAASVTINNVGAWIDETGLDYARPTRTIVLGR